MTQLRGAAADTPAAPAARGDGMMYGTESEVLRQRAAKARQEVRLAEGDRLEAEAARRG